MVYTFKTTQQLACSLAEAWAFFSSAHNLSEITPPDMNFTVLTSFEDDAIYEGMKIDYTVSPLFHIPLKWQTEIIQVDDQKSFTDFQNKGPYKLWSHHHLFESNADGVLMTDVIDYELPFGLLGTLAHRILVKKKIEHIFEYRRIKLKQRFS
ncbi:SRPBCC family protein [Flavobacterium sp. JP2137]|uniref:SRPBCC family protein n=1 Tax=Flavobacterium sp. JP2137 TaxID=3414510 RepID=UPI003D2FF2B4